MNYHTNIALRKTIADYCAVRDQAIEHYNMVKRLSGDIGSAVRAIGLYGAPCDSEPRLSVEDFRKDIDRSIWRRVFAVTGLRQYMDDQAQKEFEGGLEKDPPEFTEDNARSILVSAAAKADEYFARGLYNLFAERPADYATNHRHAFKLPRKVIWRGMIDSYWAKSFGELRIAHYASSKIDDLDRVFSTLAGREFTPYRLVSGIGLAFQKKSEYVDDMFRIRGYFAGTLHVEFIDLVLLDRANAIIARHAGAVLPDGRREKAAA